MPSVAGTARRRRVAPGIVVLAVALIGAFFVSRGCQRTQVRITKDQAVVIGQRQLDFKPQRHQVRFLRQGLSSKPTWIVIYYGRTPEGQTERRRATVYVNANTGKVEQIK